MGAASSTRAAERAAREAYGRLIARLTARTGDLAAAEDALADAFVSALERWPRDGVPARPEAWLLRVAQRRGIDATRRKAVRDRATSTLTQVAEELEEAARPDPRLQLMLVCAHPSIAANVRAPLMLQTVLGLDAKAIGQAFLVSPAAMGQRLSRAKTKIKDAGIPFALEDARAHPERLAVACEAIYAAFATGSAPDAPSVRRGLVDEALWLGRVMHEVSGRAPETAGLLALMLHVEARRPAQRRADGGFVPLDEQDPTRWDHEKLREAEALLWAAGQARTPGRFQLEAAIASAHAHRGLTGHTDWTAVVALYERLLTFADTLGGRVGYLAALAERDDPERAYALLLELPPDRVTSHQPYWALRMHLERATGRPHRDSAERAAALCEDPAVRAYLRARATDA
ncbi:MAG: DUF6596 domain-containing protein [Myxococcota bacterium]